MALMDAAQTATKTLCSCSLWSEPFSPSPSPSAPPGSVPATPTLHTVATGTLHPVPKLSCPVGTFRRGNLQLKVGRISLIRHRLVWTCLQEIINSPLVDCACHARTRRETCCWCWSHLLEHPVPSEAAPARPVRPCPRPELTTLPSLSSPAAAEWVITKRICAKTLQFRPSLGKYKPCYWIITCLTWPAQAGKVRICIQARSPIIWLSRQTWDCFAVHWSVVSRILVTSAMGLEC